MYWSEKIPLSLLFCISALFVGTGDYLAKKWSLAPSWGLLTSALGCYLVSSFFYLQTLLRKGLVISSLIWSIASIIAFLFVGLVVFRETLSTVQLLGVVAGIISVLLLSL